MRFRGQIWGWALATRSFPSHTLGALAFAGRMLPDATLRGMQSSRSHGGIAPAVPGWSLLSEASSPSSVAPCQGRHAGRGADTPTSALFRVGTVTTGTAPAFGRPFAPRYGSDLLTLRLLSLCSWVTCISHPAQLRNFHGLCLARSLPAVSPPFRAPSRFYRFRAFWRGRPAGNRDCVLVCAVATIPSW